MSTTPRRTPWTRWLVTLGLGATASAAMWLAGAHDVAYLGFVIAAMGRETLHAPSCGRRLQLRRRP